MNKEINTKLYDLLFAIFYIVLFPLQMLPALTACFVGPAGVLFWVACGIGLIAMVVQAIKFPCFGIRIWSLANLASTIVAVIACNMGV